MRRRDFITTSGALVVSFSLGLHRWAEANDPPQELPGSLRDTPYLDAWIRIDGGGEVTVFTGKAELGQGIETALAQIAADELDVALERIRMVTADTGRTPNEGYTAGSMSIQRSGTALRYAAAETRAILLGLASERLGRPAEELEVDDGHIRSGGAEVTYWELVGEQTLHRRSTGSVAPKDPARLLHVGRPVQRLDLPAKVFGEESFVQDLRLPGMLHGRVVRPPGYGSRLESVETARTEKLPGVVKVVREGSFLAVLADREDQAVSAADRLSRDAHWSGSVALPRDGQLAELLRELPSTRFVVSEQGDPESTRELAAVSIQAEYSRPFIAHASIGPSCAVAVVRDGQWTIWTHSQGVYPLRDALAGVLGLPPGKLRVIHVDGAGCYGHNGADDAACDAALLARAMPGRPVRVHWSREDEFAWEPFGPAMSFRLHASLDAKGRIASWGHELWSPPQSFRPSARRSTLLGGRHAASVSVTGAAPGSWGSGGADRNSIPPYRLGQHRIVAHMVSDLPVRVSALRGLGAFGNVFAIESFMDELAHATGQDPFAFRLHHLEDGRARTVLETVARRSGWKGDERSSSGRGHGVAFARYKNAATYCAVVAEVSVESGTGKVRVDRAWAAVDAGRIVNPDGLRNQIEGGMVQASSWTIEEAVRFSSDRISSIDWSGYPILTFESAPNVEIELIDRPSEPSLGAGEAAQGPMGAAIANAVFAATGVRVRDLPISPGRLRGRWIDSGEPERAEKRPKSD
jgi:CO/xanthine dehydrogenase Mo-binding subunit